MIEQTFEGSPHLFYAEVSLDLSRGEWGAALRKLREGTALLGGTYLFHLLEARARKGSGDLHGAQESLKQCCSLAPANQVAWNELVALRSDPALAGAAKSDDPVTTELEQLSAALLQFEPALTSETADPTPIVEQKQPFSDDEAIAVPTESLAQLFTLQGAYKKAIRIYTTLIHLHPENAATYQKEIDQLLERL